MNHLRALEQHNIVLFIRHITVLMFALFVYKTTHTYAINDTVEYLIDVETNIIGIYFLVQLVGAQLKSSKKRICFTNI